MVLGVALAFLSAMGFGSGQILVRVITQRVPIPLATFLAVLISTLLNLSLAIVLDLHGFREISLEALGWLAFLGGIAVVGGRLLNFNAISMVGAARAAPFSSSSPIFAAILAIVLLGERPGPLVGFGTLIVACGLTLVGWGGARGRGGLPGMNPRVLGYFLAAGAAVAFATSNVVSKHVVSDFTSPLVAAGVSLLLGLILLSALTGRVVMKEIARCPPTYGLLCLLAGVFQGLAQLSLLEALSRAPVTMVTPIYASSPLLTIVMAHLFLRRLERVNLFIVAGALSTVGGVIMVLTTLG